MATFLSTGSLGDLGRSHITQGKLTFSSGAATLVSNDADASVADTGTGNYTVTFGTIWSAAPTVIAQAVKATHSITVHNSVIVERVSTTVVEFRWLQQNAADATGNTSPNPADTEEIHFTATGIATALT